MNGLGTLLEQARLEQGFTIEEMAQRTKIRPQFLEAIETENFRYLPGEAYIMPFIRTYSRALGVESQIEMEISARLVVPEELAASIRERRVRNRRARRTRLLIRLGVAGAVLVGVGFLIYKLMFV